MFLFSRTTRQALGPLNLRLNRYRSLSSPEVKRPKHETDYSRQTSAELVELHPYFPLSHHGVYKDNFTFYKI